MNTREQLEVLAAEVKPLSASYKLILDKLLYLESAHHALMKLQGEQADRITALEDLNSSPVEDSPVE